MKADTGLVLALVLMAALGMLVLSLWPLIGLAAITTVF